MILPHQEIIRRIDADEIVVRPFSHDLVQPASLDVRLGRQVKVAQFVGHRVHALIDDGPLYLTNTMFVLGATLEWVEVPNGLIARIEGKSTLARRGMVIENAGFVDPGWQGELTLEMTNLAPRPIVLEHGMLIGQVRFDLMFAPTDLPYGSEGAGSHYQGSRGPVEAAL